jgi:GNAT superfamily N-acetyltransferase
MGGTDFGLRPLRPEDGYAYAALLAADADSGRIGMAERFEIDPYQALVGVNANSAGIVAEAPGCEGLAGGVLIRLGLCQWEGEVRQSALLNTLVVHPDFRRRGLATQLEDHAVRQFGKDGVFYAFIQHNNIGSERATRKWADRIVRDRLAVIPMTVRSARRSKRFVVRPAASEELATVAEGMNAYYRDYDLYPPETAASLTECLNRTPFEWPFRHYRVVTDVHGSLLGGMAVAETYRLRTTLITRMPPMLRLLNLIVRVVPASGQLRELTVSRAWFAPGQQETMRHLLDATRGEWSKVGASLVVSADVHSPLMEVCRVRPWTGTMIASLAVRSPAAYSEDRLLYYG